MNREQCCYLIVDFFEMCQSGNNVPNGKGELALCVGLQSLLQCRVLPSLWAFHGVDGFEEDRPLFSSVSLCLSCLALPHKWTRILCHGQESPRSIFFSSLPPWPLRFVPSLGALTRTAWLGCDLPVLRCTYCFSFCN